MQKCRETRVFERMSRWLKQDMIQKPMIRTENKLVKKESAEVFKLVQVFMGDRKINRDAPMSSLVMDVVVKGWNIAELRDEIFIQLCRQTTRNPREYVCDFSVSAPCPRSPMVKPLGRHVQ